MTFKVGDRVITRTDDVEYSGLKGVVVEKENWDNADEYRVSLDDPMGGPAIVYNEHELELLREGVEALEQEESDGSTGAGYYDFPGGVEVRQISAHLTGFGAQALQYVARATRLDGKNKGDVVSDLNKAIDFIRWEIERLQGDSK